jgi:hypothetical protein
MKLSPNADFVAAGSSSGDVRSAPKHKRHDHSHVLTDTHWWPLQLLLFSVETGKHMESLKTGTDYLASVAFVRKILSSCRVDRAPSLFLLAPAPLLPHPHLPTFALAEPKLQAACLRQHARHHHRL